MRTGIFVYQQTTLTFRADETVVLTAFSDNHQITVDPTTSQATVPADCYKAQTVDPISVSGDNADVVAIANDKDSFPEPPIRAQTALGMTSSNTSSFFAPDGKSMAF
jgi:hypothetical protein